MRPKSTRPIRFLKGYLFIFACAIGLGSFFYIQSMVSELSEGTRTISRIYADFCAKATLPAAESASPETEIIFREVIRMIKFPVVVTDPRGVPRAWRNIGVDSKLVSAEELEQVDPENPPPGVISRIFRTVDRLDREHRPIPMVYEDQMLGWVHYGNSPAVRRLKWTPLVQTGVVALFILIGLWGFRIARKGEQNYIWAGMAKETAHQLGTPLSSLMGWTEVLRGEGEDKSVVKEMERDLSRLEIVASRFSKIGSLPSYQREDPKPIIQSTVEYFRGRLPRLKKKVEIKASLPSSLPRVDLDSELFSWALENLVKNSLDAIQDDEGRIEIAAAGKRGFLEIRVKDTGKGMTKAERKRAFQPGYSTKSFGWGLGLPLVRRIVEEYHRGRLLIESSRPGKGTTVLILLSLPQGEQDVNATTD